MNDFLKRQSSSGSKDLIRMAQDVSSGLFSGGLSNSEISKALEKDSEHMKFAEESENYALALGLTTPLFVFNGRLKLNHKEDLKSWIMTSLRMDMSTYQRLIYTKQMPIKEKNPLTYLLKENQLISSYSPALESLFLNKKPEFVGSMNENLDWTHGELSTKNKNARVSIVIKGGNAELLKESAKRLPTRTRIATAPSSSSSSHDVIVNGWVLHSRDPIQANDLVVLDDIERSYRANLVSEMTDDLDDNLFTSLCAFLGTWCSSAKRENIHRAFFKSLRKTYIVLFSNR